MAYNDVDYCLKLWQKGLLNVYTPRAEAYHYESKSRGLDTFRRTPAAMSGRKRLFTASTRRILIITIRIITHISTICLKTSA